MSKAGPSSHMDFDPYLSSSQDYDTFFILDFEATCDTNRKIYPQVRNTF